MDVNSYNYRPQFDDKRFFHHVYMPTPLDLSIANKRKYEKTLNLHFIYYGVDT